MTTMTKNELLENLANYGYPLLEPRTKRAEEVLENLLMQDDSRLLEGFPVVFLRALQEGTTLDWERSDWSPDRLSPKAKSRLPYFLALSVELLNGSKTGKSETLRVLKLLGQFQNSKEVIRAVAQAFESSGTVQFEGHELSCERLKKTFETYTQTMPAKQGTAQKKHALELELLLSQLFTPCQKRLMKKKSAGENLSKTEKEYFSRVVKKRLRALANDNLHAFACKLLQSR